MEHPILYRKRFIPYECKLLQDDIVLEYNSSILVTKWNVLKERCDFSHGYSCCYLDKGYRISKFLTKKGEFLCWYCDIITHEQDLANNSLTIIDLLADVIIYPDGKMRIVDLDELYEAFDTELIDKTLLKKSLLSLNKLLDDIYSVGIEALALPIKKYDQ